MEPEEQLQQMMKAKAKDGNTGDPASTADVTPLFGGNPASVSGSDSSPNNSWVFNLDVMLNHSAELLGGKHVVLQHMEQFWGRQPSCLGPNITTFPF